MRENPGWPEGAPAPGSEPLAMATAPTRESALTLPHVTLPWPAWLRAPRITVSPLVGRLALGALVLATLAVVATAAGGPSILVPRSAQVFPNWEAGPLHLIHLRPTTSPHTLDIAFSVVLVAMFVAYGLVVGAVRSFSMRTIVIAIVVLHVVLVFSPPLQLTDVFNYLGYARLGGLHHLVPYTHPIKQELFDPVYRFSSWHNLKSPYGELFTAITYPLGLLSLPTAYWVLKLVTVALSLAFIALVYRCAKQLNRDPRFAVAFVALNPVFLIYELGGFHNDFYMLVPMLGSMTLVLAGRDRSAGASLTVAFFVKFTAILLGPFLLLAVANRVRGRRVIEGALIAAVPLVIMSVVLFGVALPNLQQQSTLLTDFSVPNLVGLIFGVGGTPHLLDLADVIVVGVVLYHWLYRRSNWIIGAGWSTLALILSLSWAVPWYIVWVLPLAALGTSIRLRRWSIIATAFLMLAFLPVTSLYMSRHNIDPLNTPAGRASQSLQNKLAN